MRHPPGLRVLFSERFLKVDFSPVVSLWKQADRRHERDAVERRGACQVARCNPSRFGLPAYSS